MTPSLRFGLAILGLVATTSFCPATAEPPPCAVVPPPVPTDLPSFGEDARYDLHLGERDQQATLHITGDILRVTENDYASITGTMARARTKTASLVLDGRIVELRAPLSFYGGKLTIRADELVIGPGAAINLLHHPTSPNRGLDIVARKIVVSPDGPSRPFFVDLASPGEATLRLVSESIRKPSATADSTPERDDLWRLVGDSLELDISPPSSILLTGGEAAATFRESFAEQMTWPLQTAAKIRKFFERDPYGAASGAELKRICSAYRSLFAEYPNPRPFLVAEHVVSSLERGVDLEGRSASFVPRENLQNQIQDLESQADNQVVFDDLRLLIESSSVRDPLSLASIKQILQTQGDLKTKAASLRSAIDRDLEALAKSSQSAQGVSDQVGQQKAILEELTNRELKQRREAEAGRKWAAVGAAAIAIAATAGAATPAVAAAAGAGVTLIGEAAYNYNTGQQLTLEQVAAVGAASYKAASDVSTAWTEYKAAETAAVKVFQNEAVLVGPAPKPGEADTRKPLGRTDAVRAWGEKLASVVQAAKALNGQGVAAPAPITLAEREAADPTMRDLVARLSALRVAQSALNAAISARVDELGDTQLRLFEVQQAEFDLREVDAQNDREIQRWRSNAIELWRSYVGRAADGVSLARRSLFFETGQLPSGPSDVLYYPDELASLLALGILDPGNGLQGEAAASRLKAHLLQEQTRFLVSIRGVVAGLKASQKAYFNRRVAANVYRQGVTYKAGSGRAVDKRFIAQLNSQIAQQIVTNTPLSGIAPVPVPYVLPAPANSYPERLVSMTVTKVRFRQSADRIGDNALRFVLQHPGYGMMQRDTDCFLVDLREHGTGAQTFVVPLEQVSPSWLSSTPKAIEIREGTPDRFYTYYPARAPYLLAVQVLSTHWKGLPEIVEISFGLEIMQ